MVHPASAAHRRSRRRATTGAAKTVDTSRRTAVFTPVSRCVASQGGTSVTGRWESGKAEHRAFGAMASFAFVDGFRPLAETAPQTLHAG